MKRFTVLKGKKQAKGLECANPLLKQMVDVEQDQSERLSELESENESLRGALILLHRIANLVRGAVELEPTCYALLTGVSAGVGLGLNRAMIFLVDESDRKILKGASAVGPASAEEADRAWRSIQADSPDLEALYQAGLEHREHPSELDRLIASLTVDARGETPIALALKKGTLVTGEGRDDLDGLLHLPTSMAAPMRGKSSVRGVLYADNCFTGKEPTPGAQLVFALIADHAGRAIESAHHFEQVSHLARTDALTGLSHHGTLMEELGQAISRALSSRQHLGILMIDLDDFKKINDTYGHLAGDALLVGIASRIQTVARSGEAHYRYGGEEFAVLLPGADLAKATHVGERIRQAVSAHPFTTGKEQSIDMTCSVGVASFPRFGHDAKSLVEVADEALLKAKRLGKNRVEQARIESKEEAS